MTGPTAATDDPREIEGAWSTVRRAIRLNPELRVGLAWTVVLALIATAGRAITPIAVQRTIDIGLNGGGGPVDLPATGRQVGAAAIAVLVTALASSRMNVRLATTVETALSELRVRAFAHIHDLSILHQATEQRGILVARVTTDIDEVSRFMQWGGLNLITSTGMLLVALVVMFVYSWQLAFVVLAAFLPFILGVGWFQRRLTVAFQSARHLLGRLLGTVAETVVGAPVVRAYGIEERTADRIDTAIDDHLQAALRAGRLSSVFSGTGEIFSSVATAGVVLAGVLLGVNGTLSSGTVVAFLFLVTMFVGPVNVASETINEAQNAIAGWRRVLDVLDIEPDVADPVDGTEIPAGPIGITFEGVAFAYPVERHLTTTDVHLGPLVLDDLTLEIAPQTKVAVVGETGSGKTTFAKLLTRLMDPTAGTIELNGIELRDIRFASLRDRVVMVPQDGMLFEGTIADNLRLAAPELDDDDLRLACIELGIVDWVDSLDAGLLTSVGERGGGLSAGERQLVALARAYVANPDLLVLDEATSAVDPATEVRLQRAVNGLTSGRTTVTIAHRMSTAEQADEVLVFDQGSLVERGTHEQLVAAGGVYGRLHDSWRTGRVSA